ncbi:B3 domain-containing transcription factor LEC2-like protein [Tanacetum coccineum]
MQAKIARANRKMALQMRAIKKTRESSTSSRGSPAIITRNISARSNQYQYIFYTPDNVKLSFVLRKKLTCSDVGDHGRILLPKWGAEENLPSLASKEGVDIVMKEVYSNTQWIVKYRFWDNQKGKMYLFDHCADFIKQNLLEAGDQLELYQDEHKNLYFTILKKEPSSLVEEIESKKDNEAH